MTVYCRDCKHRVPYELNKVSRFDTCDRVFRRLDPDALVTGAEVTIQFSYCSVERSSLSSDSCAEQGRFFEPIADEKGLLRRDLNTSKPTFTNSDVEGHTA